MTKVALSSASRKPGKKASWRSSSPERFPRPRRAADPVWLRCASDPRVAFSTRFPTKRAEATSTHRRRADEARGELLSEPPGSSRSICSRRRWQA